MKLFNITNYADTIIELIPTCKENLKIEKDGFTMTLFKPFAPKEWDGQQELLFACSHKDDSEHIYVLRVSENNKVTYQKYLRLVFMGILKILKIVPKNKKQEVSLNMTYDTFIQNKN